jgi:hypothetical protein
MGKKSKSGTVNSPDHISESSDTNFWIKILKFFDFDVDPDPKIVLTPGPGSDGKIRIRDKHPGSTTLLATLFFVTVNPDDNVCGGRVSETTLKTFTV